MVSRLRERLVPSEIRDDGLAKALQVLKEYQPADLPGRDQERPIFILSAGWRSGSTFLQRLVCSDQETIVWGEPFGDFIPILRLAKSLAGFEVNDEHLLNTIGNFEGSLADSWIANLNPGPSVLWRAHRAFFDEAFAAPARKIDYRRWGIKEVRLTGAHAQYLRWLYPQARVVFLVRNPLDAYASYNAKVTEQFRTHVAERSWRYKLLHPSKMNRMRSEKNWYTVRPDYSMDSAYKFMAHWAYLTDTFLEMRDQDGMAWFRYEDLLADPASIDRLGDFLQVAIDRKVIDHRIGGSSAGKRYSAESQFAYWLLAARTAQQAGY